MRVELKELGWREKVYEVKTKETHSHKREEEEVSK